VPFQRAAGYGTTARDEEDKGNGRDGSLSLWRKSNSRRLALLVSINSVSRAEPVLEGAGPRAIVRLS